MLRDDRSFLAPPDAVSDWRMLLAYDAAADAGLLSTLPATAEQAASRRGLNAHAVRAALDVLAEWRIIERHADGRYRTGRAAPSADLAALYRHHARSIRLWAATLEHRLRGTSPGGARPPARRDLWYAALAAFAQPTSAAVVNACLTRFPSARSVLDLGGGHGQHALAFARRGLSATMQDRADAVELARANGREDDGVVLFAGDFFETLPDGPFDLVFCAALTETYDGSHNAALFERIRPILSPHGGVALLAFVYGRDPAVAAFAVQMLVAGNGGDTHSEADYRRWLGDTGYRDVDVIDLDGQPQSLVFATRA